MRMSNDRGWRRGLLLLALAITGPAMAQVPLATQQIDAAGAFPESMTVAPDGALIFGALSGNHILRASDARHVVRWIAVPGPGVSIYGVLADAARDTLWSCIVRRVDGGLQTSLNRYTLQTGAFVSATLFPGRGRCNDISVGPDGVVYATDIEAGRLFSLDTASGALRLLLDDAALKGIDGIAWLGGVLYANNFRTGTLDRVQWPASSTGATTLVAQTLSRPLQKPDGMRITPDGALLVAEGVGRLSLLRPCGADCFQVSTLAERLDGPTAVSVRDGMAWVVDARLRERAAVAQGTLAPSGFIARGYCMADACR
jgi:sugar lactone lactonase YvrE